MTASTESCASAGCSVAYAAGWMEKIRASAPYQSDFKRVALARRPAFDMPVDCAAGTLHVAEPMPLMRGGGGYEVVNLATLSATAPRRT